jgi:signal transduction histidine kinase
MNDGLLQGIIEGASDAISAVDHNLRLLVFNTAFVRFHQTHNKTTPRVGDYVPDLITTLSDEFKENAVNLFRRSLSGEEFTSLYQRPHEGRIEFFEFRFSPLYLGGQLVGSAQNMRNVTTEHEAVLKFEDYAHQLELSNKELYQFAFIASHDLQEPLKKIQAFGQRLAAQVGLDEEGRDFLNRMRLATTRMQQLIDDLLDYSRVTTQGRPPEPIDLNRAVAEASSDLQVRVQETGAMIEVDRFPPALGDPGQMRQLFLNLIGNALKYHRPDVPPYIHVGLETHSGIATIVVSDQGIGFDQSDAERIFEVFQRLHGRSEYEGTGIGLAICRKIVQRHGGTISAEGRPGEGARFLITFPKTFWGKAA